MVADSDFVIKCWLQTFTAGSRATWYEGIEAGLRFLVCDCVFLTSEFLCLGVCACANKGVPLIKHSTLPSQSAHDLLSVISLLLTPKKPE
jgi:hypothetical protein